MEERDLLQSFAQEAAPAAQEQAAAPAAAGDRDTDAGTPGEAGVPEQTEPPAAPQETPPEGETAADGEDRARLLQSVSEALKAQQKDAGVRQVIAAWESESEALRSLYPGFDLKQEVRDPAFAELLRAGVGVRRAYEAAHLEQILGTALRYAAVTAGKKTADSVRSQAGRVQENSVLDRASSLPHRDVNNLTKADILKILDEVSRGAKIKF